MRAFRLVVWAVGGVAVLGGCSDEAAFDGGGAGQNAGGQATAGTTSNQPPGAGSPAASGSANVGGSAVAGGSTSGGASQAGSAGIGGTSANAGTAPGGGAGGSGGGGGGVTVPTNKVFSQCRLHFGTIDSKAKENAALIPELDFFTPGWMGLSDTFDQKYVCDEGKEGAVLGKLVPVIVAYVSAFYVKRHHGGLCDCNVSGCGMVDGKVNDLCHFGSQHIQADLPAILNVYKSYAQGYAACYGTTRPIIFEMEPDWYQYTDPNQNDPMTKEEAGTILAQYVDAIRSALPNAYFSIDVSPWVDDNGTTNGKDWYSHFDLSKFTFVNTSGGSTLGANVKIRSDNLMTWAGVSGVTGRGVLADTGYGANGISAGHDANWDSADNLNARLADGVVSISQYNPKSDWANTIKGIRSQLKMPKFCP